MQGINKLVNKLEENVHSIHISRVPMKAKRTFVKLANEDFCGDYGMCLKFLLEGLINPDLQIIIERLEALEEKIMVPEKEVSISKERVINKLDGTKIRVSEQEEKTK